MNDKNLYAALNENVTMVTVKFQDGANTKGYSYKALKVDNLKVGDSVVVPVTKEGEDKFFVAVVSEIQENKFFDDSISYKWLVQRVDTERWSLLKEKEGKFQQALLDMERQKRREVIKKDLEERIGRDAALQLTKDL